MQALSAARDVPRIAVIVRSLDRSTLAALAFALSLSSDVRAMHVNTGGETTRLIRERWRSSADGVALEVLPDENGLSAALHDPELVIVVPTVATGPRLLYPIANWTALRDARRWRAHARAVVTLPYAA